MRYKIEKRLLDILLSFLGIIILSPLFIILSLLVLFSSKGGIFFRGVRVGQYGKPFKILKFRSMRPNSEGNGKWNVGDNDNRITKIGHFLRKTKLDELPQLFLVFIGKMSFVGPRPELQYYIDMYTSEEKKILEMKPGITDWATMVNMKQFEEFTKSNDPDEYYLTMVRPLKLKLQLYYYQTRSLGKDAQIVFLTIYKVITRSNKLPRDIEFWVNKWKYELRYGKQN